MDDSTLFETLCGHLRRDENEMREASSPYVNDVVSGLIGRRGELVHTWWHVLTQLDHSSGSDVGIARLRGEADTLRAVLVRMVEYYEARRPEAA